MGKLIHRLDTAEMRIIKLKVSSEDIMYNAIETKRKYERLRDSESN